ncbi:MAG: ABC transporter permease [Muribaculaceae bacterium]|nr:ABC transporter permease [Muribaculaceae bacterium]
MIKLRRSNGAVSAIAIVSIVGIAVAVAAIVCVLSVFNGFKQVLSERSDRMLTDIQITPVISKTLNTDSILPLLRRTPGVEIATDIVSDQALVIYNQSELPVQLYAADLNTLHHITDIDSIIHRGGSYPSAEVAFDTAPEGLIAVGPAARLGTYENNETLFIFTPKRIGTINPANPMASFITDSVRITGVFESGDERFDSNTLIVSPEVARPLFMLDDNQANSIAVKAAPHTDIDRLADMIHNTLVNAGQNVNVLTREQQQQTNFRMINIEKWVTFLLLSFMLVIASFNIISTMTMFILEKQRDIRIIRALGANRHDIASIFALQSLFVTAIGTIAGLITGVLLSLGQQTYGWIAMGPSSDDGIPALAYPVKVIPSDCLVIIIPIALIGGITALIAAAFARSRCVQTHL